MKKKPEPPLSEVDSIKLPPFETNELRNQISEFFKRPYADPATNTMKPIGSYIWGVYAFYDYDGEQIYVGQTP